MKGVIQLTYLIILLGEERMRPLHAPFTILTRAMGIGYRLFRPREEEKLSIIPPFSTIITTFAPLLLTNI